MKYVRRMSVWLAVFSMVISPAGASSGKPNVKFTAELMIANEDVGDVYFSSTRSKLYIQRFEPYKTTKSFEHLDPRSRDRTHLLVVERPGSEKSSIVRPLPEHNTWFLRESPDGSRVAVGWMDEGIARLGVLDASDNSVKTLDVPIALNTQHGTTVGWLDDRRLLVFSMAPTEQRRTDNSRAHAFHTIVGGTHTTWGGRKPGVHVLGSGRYFQHESAIPQNRLLVVDVQTGEADTVAANVQEDSLEVAPGGRRAAFLKPKDGVDLNEAPLIGSELAAHLYDLVLFDTERGVTRISACEGCSVPRGSIRWSPLGNQLFFSMGSASTGVRSHHVYDFTARTRREIEIGVEGWDRSYSNRDVEFREPLIWLDEQSLAVRVPRTGRSDQSRRFDWMLIDDDGRAVRSLTRDVHTGIDEAAFDAPLGVFEGSLLLAGDGELWRFDPHGSARNITRALPQKVRSWCPYYAPGANLHPALPCTALAPTGMRRNFNEVSLARGLIAVGLIDDDRLYGRFAVLNLRTGRVEQVSRAARDAVPWAVSPLWKAAVHRRTDERGDELVFVGDRGSKVTLLRLNEHLTGVRSARKVVLTRRGAGGDGVEDILLLPPEHKAGQRHPLLVYFYPGHEASSLESLNSLTDVFFLNMQLAAASGHAVLLVSTQMSRLGDPHAAPMTELQGQLIAAAENAVEHGYADPVRWALIGHSYGGYAVMGVITQTDRFKAAIALAGLSNLTDGYAAMGRETALFGLARALQVGAGWAEGSQGRMGVPPWEHPDRYIQNSPYFYADKVNTPLLLIHGDRDPSAASVRQSEQMYYALLRLNKDSLFVRYWGEVHNIFSPANIVDMWGRIDSWLAVHLGAIGVCPQEEVASLLSPRKSSSDLPNAGHRDSNRLRCAASLAPP